MSCASPLPAPIVLSVCGTCPQCCSVTAFKRTRERIQLSMPWHHRLPQDGTVWTVKRTSHTVKMSTGASLTNPQYDPASAYALGVTVSFGARLYISTDEVPAGEPPMEVTGVNADYWDDAGVNPHVYVALDTDAALEQWVNKDLVASHALVAGGEADTDYRVEIMTTFRDCEGREIELWDCVLVKVEDCT